MKSRFNLYRPIHKGLRKELVELLVEAGSADPTNLESVRAVTARFGRAARLVDSHHHHEDMHLGPILARLAPAIHAEMEVDHGALDRDLASLRDLADRVVLDANRSERLQAFYLGFAAFVSRFFLHLDREEHAYMEALHAAYSDEELHAIDGAIVSSVEPDLLPVFFSLMIPAMRPPERVELLAGARANAPAPVFEGMCQLAKAALPAPAWDDLRAALALPAAMHAVQAHPA